MISARVPEIPAPWRAGPRFPGGWRTALLVASSWIAIGTIAGCRRASETSLAPRRDESPAAAHAVAERIPAAHAVTEKAAAPAPTQTRSPSTPPPEGMVWIPGGTFWMGADDGTMQDAGPVHEVTVDGFWMDRTEVTNREFAAFVAATGYVTEAERRPDPKDFPDVPEEKLVPGALVFTPPTGEVSLENPMVWWRFVPGAEWRHPEGPGSSIEGKESHPVVQVCWDDAAAYARWAGKRLPTEAEWEYAARGGSVRKRFLWGDELRPGGRWQANIWQGHFPEQGSAEDGYNRTAPVGTFPANGFGLFDMAGNVWEWCADWYRPGYDVRETRNPKGPPSSYDPDEPGARKRVQRGGSFLCSDQYCSRYLPGARGKWAVDTGSTHVGFRCVLSPADRAAADADRAGRTGSPP